ncbi:MAG: DUF2508 family protein [Syntrophomonadaceae bacterium]|nr:DUF2508 family protein [Bacillota bacterium]NLP22979.1 DUF2508 family protein [Syntrophomonadaceae bacterium]
MKNLSTLWTKLRQLLELNDDRTVETVIAEEQLLEEAYQELIEARGLFTQAQEPDMIDYAIFHLNAAEQRYDYLIRGIKTRGGYIRPVEKGELDGNN